ncbi:EF-hand domain-containing protein [Martelella alba]|uniref:EF-hand domain-containing protein n=1 Tax=Martelella alba TaxID=2590451 RepID=A0ABY2SNN2_9HYPH|nr:EF-hand domain-containing protein [Martelella alba]TKI06105.1 EF-hand domain-containing protein [Martelella alba]
MKAYLIPVLVMLTAVSVHAAEQQYSRLQSRFTRADTNHDGKLTLDEAKSGMPMVAKYFSEIDAGHTGYVTLPQLEQFMASHQRQ